MTAGLLMLGMVAWVLMSALLTAMFVLLQVVREEVERMSDSVYEDDGSDEWLA